MTIELDVTAAGSHFPRDPARSAARPSGRQDLISPWFCQTVSPGSPPDVIHITRQPPLWFAYPYYQRQAIHFPPVRICRIIAAAAVASRTRPQGQRRQTRWSGHTPSSSFHQLEGDFQIRDRSPFKGIEYLELIRNPFAGHALGILQHLVPKSHPPPTPAPRAAGRARCNGSSAGPRWFGCPGEAFSTVAAPDRSFIARAGATVTINGSGGTEALLAGRPVRRPLHRRPIFRRV